MIYCYVMLPAVCLCNNGLFQFDLAVYCLRRCWRSSQNAIFGNDFHILIYQELIELNSSVSLFKFPRSFTVCFLSFHVFHAYSRNKQKFSSQDFSSCSREESLAVNDMVDLYKSSKCYGDVTHQNSLQWLLHVVRKAKGVC